MTNGIRTGNPRGFNKGRSLKFREGSLVRQTPEEGRRTYRPKCCEITIKMKTIGRKPLMIKIIKLRLRNVDNFIVDVIAPLLLSFCVKEFINNWFQVSKWNPGFITLVQRRILRMKR